MSALFTDAVLLRSLMLFLLLGSVVGLLAGMALLLRPQWLQHLSKLSNRWISTRQMGRSLQQPVNIDHWFYRYGYLSGIVLLAGASYIIYMLTTHIVRADILPVLDRMHLVPYVLLEPLLDTLVLVFLVGAILAAIISLFLIFRPSLLRDLELGANRNVSLRQTLKPAEVLRGNVDKLVYRHVRLTGAALVCGSLYTLVVLVLWWFR